MLSSNDLVVYGKGFANMLIVIAGECGGYRHRGRYRCGCEVHGRMRMCCPLFSFRVRMRLWKLHPYFSYTISKFQANLLTLPAVAATGLEKVYWCGSTTALSNGEPCRWSAPKTIQNGLTAQRTFRVDQVFVYLESVS